MKFVVRLRFTSITLAALLIAFVSESSAEPITAVPPAAYVPPIVAKAAPLARLVAADAPKRTISLPPPSDAEWSKLRDKNRAPSPVGPLVTKPKALAIGFARELAPADRAIDASALAWIPIADGGYAARIDVQSQGAAGVRIALAMAETNPDVTVRFAGSATTSRIVAVPANAIAGATLRDGSYWSPVLEGDTATIEIVALAGVDRSAIALSIVRVMHLAVAGASLRAPTQKDATDIGTSGSCNVDVKCQPQTPALVAAANATALIVFNDTQFMYQCSGTLVNDSLATNTPYFYTANHCVDSQALATTVNFYWFFDAVACNDHTTVPPYVTQTGGAMLLGRSDDWDWSLMRANTALPAGVAFSGWRAEPLAAGDAAISLHHPNGDLKKVTSGTFQGYYTRSGRTSTFATMLWAQGSTEPGSSGGGLLTLGPSGTYELRGGLWAGSASCSNPGGTDQFSRLDVALPLLRQYLTPNDASPNGAVAAVEFYHAGLDHYFISTNPVEINDLDTGVHAGWVRTGFRFLAYPDAAHAPAGASPVCRFYLKPAFGDSHFFSGSPTECAETAAKFGNAWVYESPNVFYIQLPDQASGACPANTRPMWRFFHTTRTNHRYTTEIAVRDDLRSNPEWLPEGYGPDAVIMCTPAS